MTANLADDWTAERFLAADQERFGPLWRYELVDGRIIGRAAKSDRQATILVNLAAALKSRMNGFVASTGSGVIPRNQANPTVRVPDVTILGNRLPRATFDVVSLADSTAWQQLDYRRAHLQDVDDVQEIFEICPDQVAARVYRKAGGTWQFVAFGGGATLDVTSAGISLPIAALYDDVDLNNEEREE